MLRRLLFAVAVPRLGRSAPRRATLWRKRGGKPEERRIAVLIDGDNAASSTIHKLFASSSQPDTISFKCVYGDFSMQGLARWQELMLKHSIVPVHWFRNTCYKNATDMRMAVDAMDLLYTRAYDEFWIVSSDSDFTALAWRIRREGLVVRGFGDLKTPQAFVDACDEFTYTNKADPVIGPAKTNKAQGIADTLRTAVAECAIAEGWAPLTAIGASLRAMIPGFRPNQFGFSKMSALVRSMEFLEVVWRGDAVLVRVREHDLLPSANAESDPPVSGASR
jgi:uncharacterized LabA/DUF88 family protein